MAKAKNTVTVYVVRRLDWDDNFRTEEELEANSVRSFLTPEKAEAHRAQLEREGRGDQNPFEYGYRCPRIIGDYSTLAEQTSRWPGWMHWQGCDRPSLAAGIPVLDLLLRMVRRFTRSRRGATPCRLGRPRPRATLRGGAPPGRDGRADGPVEARTPVRPREADVLTFANMDSCTRQRSPPLPRKCPPPTRAGRGAVSSPCSPCTRDTTRSGRSSTKRRPRRFEKPSKTKRGRGSTRSSFGSLEGLDRPRRRAAPR